MMRGYTIIERTALFTEFFYKFLQLLTRIIKTTRGTLSRTINYLIKLCENRDCDKKKENNKKDPTELQSVMKAAIYFL